ncbi:MAG: hypothetical protein LBT78_05795 [Tannerella sp.]|jgi:hypothetical protein|nr:hypothetical protein [Tannerella sp.]
MTDKQNAKLNMAQRVSDVCAANQNLYGSVTPIVTAVDELNAVIGDIRGVEKEQGAVPVTGASKEKREVEEILIGQSVIMANCLYVIGFTTHDQELLLLSSLSANTFYKAEGNEKLALAGRILDLANQHTDDLAPYGDAVSVDRLQQAIERYRAIISKPMDYVGSRKQKTTNLRQLFAALDSVFYDKLDKLIVLFKLSYPHFYDEYKTARNLINTSVRHKKAGDE